MDQTKNLKTYIWQQLQSGVQPVEIRQQLLGGGWTVEAVDAAFADISRELSAPQPAASLDEEQRPSVTPQAAATQTLPAEPAVKRGRIKTAWLLLKQSLKLLNHHRELVRYPLMSFAISMVLLILLVIVYIANPGEALYTTYQVQEGAGMVTRTQSTGVGIFVILAAYIALGFITFLYAAGLSAHVLDLYRGSSKRYADYMALARSKSLQLLLFSTINVTVGLILATIAERFRLLGWIIAKLLGALWSLATAFTVPVIVETDKNAVAAIRHSTSLFIQTWGENVVGRITFNGIVILIYLFIFIPVLVVLSIVMTALAGFVGMILVGILAIVLLIFAIIVETTAAQILNTALYYYAQYRQIPAAFDPDLLAGVFQQKKSKKK